MYIFETWTRQLLEVVLHIMFLYNGWVVKRPVVSISWNTVYEVNFVKGIRLDMNYFVEKQYNAWCFILGGGVMLFGIFGMTTHAHRIMSSCLTNCHVLHSRTVLILVQSVCCWFHNIIVLFSFLSVFFIVSRSVRPTEWSTRSDPTMVLTKWNSTKWALRTELGRTVVNRWVDITPKFTEIRSSKVLNRFTQLNSGSSDHTWSTVSLGPWGTLEYIETTVSTWVWS